MSVIEVTMYRVECDEPECDDSPQETSDYYAWADPGQAIDDAVQADWYVATESDGTQTILCPDDAPQCKNEDCGVFLRDNEWGDVCEDHSPEAMGMVVHEPCGKFHDETFPCPGRPV